MDKMEAKVDELGKKLSKVDTLDDRIGKIELLLQKLVQNQQSPMPRSHISVLNPMIIDQLNGVVNENEQNSTTDMTSRWQQSQRNPINASNNPTDAGGSQQSSENNNVVVNTLTSNVRRQQALQNYRVG